MTMPLQLAAEPIDSRRCKFILNRAVHATGVRRFTAPSQAEDSAIAQALFEVPGVCEVVASGNVVTVVQDGSRPWDALEPQVRYAIEAAVGQLAASPAASASADPSQSGDDAMYDLVTEIFDAQINPAVAQHGGKVELVDVQEGVVVVRMLGGCQGCGMANVTLRQGIEASLRRMVSGFQGVRDITDHQAGTDPYFAPGSK